MMRLLLALLLALPVRAAPAVWEVRTATTTITLFGTVHALPRATDWFSPLIVQRLDAADALVLEAIVPEDPATLLPVVMLLARSPGLPTLASRVSAPLRPRLAAAQERLRTGSLDAYESWYAALVLASAQDAANGVDPRRGVEAVLTARARLTNKAIDALETPEEQLRLFDLLPPADQDVLLARTVEDLPGARAELTATVADWQAGRTEALAARLNEELASPPGVRKLLLTDRNARFAAWIVNRLNRPGNVFIAVGAGHLAGPDSVQAALAKYGVSAVRLDTAAPARPRTRRR